MRITVLGLGRMGAAMAARFSSLGGERGWRVGGWSRSGTTVPGVTSYPSAPEAVADADVVVLALYDGEACRSVLDQVQGALGPEVSIVNTSTVAPDEAAELAERMGGRYVHAPVLGSVPAVESGALTVLAAGASDQVGEVLTALGDVRMVRSAREAAAQKLVVNATLAGSLTLLRDVVGQARALGMSTEEALDVLGASALGGLIARKRANLDDPDAPVQFAVGALVKDMELLEQASGRPFLAADLAASADADADMAAVILASDD